MNKFCISLYDKLDNTSKFYTLEAENCTKVLFEFFKEYIGFDIKEEEYRTLEEYKTLANNHDYILGIAQI